MYRRLKISFEDVPQLSERDKAFQLKDNRLNDFIKYTPSLDKFEEVAGAKSNHAIDRKLLVSELKKQYSDIKNSDLTTSNIESLLDKKVFSIVTAHQPSLMTGPLYFIYKICSTISLSREINETHKNFQTVPVFILGGEDHDFEEIASFNLFGQTFTWETDQKGSTARMTLDGLDSVIDELFGRLGENENAVELKNIITEALANSTTYGQFMFHVTHNLFDRFGLIIINMDNRAFKSRLLPYVLRDLESKDSQRLVVKDQEDLQNRGFKGQAHAREVNIFWMNGDRQRVIALPDEKFQIGEEIITKEDLVEMLKGQPECISPNVVLRPIYQELILPNLAYIGGGGELAYWMERVSLFNEWDIPFPMLVRRDSLLIVDRKSAQWLQSSQLKVFDLFERIEQIVTKYTLAQSEVTIDLTKEKEGLHDLFKRVEIIAKNVDPTLGKTVLSESVKVAKSLDYLENKMLKAQKRKDETGVTKLVNMKKKFFPGNDGLQERSDNFMSFFLRYGHGWIDELIQHTNPLDPNFKVLIEE